jgi:hypothetical protein
MKRMISSVVVSTFALASLGAGVAIAAPATAAVRSHTSMMAKTWHGTLEKLNETMGTTESFSLKVGMKIYTVHYDSMTHWVMGTKRDLKVGALVSVTGALSGTTIVATKLSA